MRTRNIGKFIYMNEKEAAALAKKAAQTGLSESALIRMLVQGYAPKEKPDDRFYVVMRQLIGIGNNIQQICRKANALNFIDAPALEKESVKWHEFWLEVRHRYLDPEGISGPPQGSIPCGEKEQPRSGEPFASQGEGDERREL